MTARHRLLWLSEVRGEGVVGSKRGSSSRSTNPQLARYVVVPIFRANMGDEVALDALHMLASVAGLLPHTKGLMLVQRQQITSMPPPSPSLYPRALDFSRTRPKEVRLRS